MFLATSITFIIVTITMDINIENNADRKHYEADRNLNIYLNI